jgi:hypothetical protein
MRFKIFLLALALCMLSLWIACTPQVGPAGPIGAALTAHLPIAGASGTGAALPATYTASGTGAVARTVTAKLGDSISVLDYGASGSTATTTTVGSTPSGSSTVVLANGSSFSAGEGIRIPGAGLGGTNYIGTVTSITGNLATVFPATSTAVPNGTAVSHDDTASLQAARNAAVAANAPLVLSPGVFPVTNLNFSSHDHTRVIGSVGELTEILCTSATPNTGVCIDESGANDTSWEHIWLQGGTSALDAPQVVYLGGKTSVPSSNGSGHTFTDVRFSSFGSFAYYGNGAESTHFIDCVYTVPGYTGTANLSPVVLSSANSFGIKSAFTTLATPPGSETKIVFDAPTFTLGAPIIFDDDYYPSTFGQISFRDPYFNGCSAFGPAIVDTQSTWIGMVLGNLHFDNVFLEWCPTGAEYPFLSMPHTDIQHSHFDITSSPRAGLLPASILTAQDWAVNEFEINTYGVALPMLVGCTGTASVANRAWGVTGIQNPSMYCAYGFHFPDL